MRSTSKRPSASDLPTTSKSELLRRSSRNTPRVSASPVSGMRLPEASSITGSALVRNVPRMLLEPESASTVYAGRKDKRRVRRSTSLLWQLQGCDDATGCAGERHLAGLAQVERDEGMVVEFEDGVGRLRRRLDLLRVPQSVARPSFDAFRREDPDGLLVESDRADGTRLANDADQRTVAPIDARRSGCADLEERAACVDREIGEFARGFSGEDSSFELAALEAPDEQRR